MIAALRRWFAALAARDRRALRAGGRVLAAWLLWTLAVAPYVRSLGALGARLERERDLLGREMGLLTEAPDYAAQYKEIERTILEEAPRLFPSGDPIAGASMLAEHVGAAAAAHRVVIQEVETGTPEALPGGLTAFSISIRAVSDLEGIAGLLGDMERGPKLVRIFEILVLPVTSPAPLAEQAIQLTASLAGYALADSARP
jgi:hypothetical protein